MMTVFVKEFVVEEAWRGRGWSIGSLETYMGGFVEAVRDGFRGGVYFRFPVLVEGGWCLCLIMVF